MDKYYCADQIQLHIPELFLVQIPNLGGMAAIQKHNHLYLVDLFELLHQGHFQHPMQ
ncbi:hypothetical protein B565_2235 [Aeromonas veronii B565]|nr:hypothetical protein B565_2235 [Aeromonas veronii B565]